MLRVIILSVIMLTVVMLTVVAPSISMTERRNLQNRKKKKKKCFVRRVNTTTATRASTIKTLQICNVIFRSKLACLSKPVKVTDNDKNTSLLQNRYVFAHCEYLKFFSTGPR